MSLPRYTPVIPSPEVLVHMMDIACLAADAAAKVTLASFRQAVAVENKAGPGGFDPVTIADREAELAIRNVLVGHFPDVGFLGEEHEAIEGSSGLMWVVDPIDGTRAFMSGMPLWGTLIGLYNGQDAILGILDQPFLQERYTGMGTKAQLICRDSRSVLSTRHTAGLADAVAYCTTPDMFTEKGARARFERVRDTVKLMRYGGDCYAYALLAAGHVDIAIDCDLKPYDIQALIPLIHAAGGVVTTWQGDSAVDGGYVVASGSAALHEELLELLA